MKNNNNFCLLIFFIGVITTINAQINQYHNDGTRHGLWEKKYEGTDEIRYIGNFNHGVEIGTFKYYVKGFPARPSATKTFSNNGEVAELVYFTQLGHKMSKGKLINRKREGKWEYYHKGNGKIMMIENYVNDKLEGERISYYSNGEVSETLTYVNGKREGKQLVYSVKGVLIKEFTYENDLLHGINKIFNGRGELLIEGSFFQNKKKGIWKYYERGKFVREKKYK